MMMRRVIRSSSICCNIVINPGPHGGIEGSLPLMLKRPCSSDGDNSVRQRGRRVKIYTKTGDTGRSSLFTGERRDKDDIIFTALGSVDELSSSIGFADAVCRQFGQHDLCLLREVQCVLQDVSSCLATPRDSARDAHLERVVFDDDRVTKDLEAHIDHYMEQLPPLTNFILPSGGVSSSALHVARAKCRHSERCVVALVRREGQEGLEGVLSYLNRLSDLLFTLARYVSHADGKEEYVYRKIDGHASVVTTTNTPGGKRHYSTTTSVMQSQAPMPQFNVTLANIYSSENRERSVEGLHRVTPIRTRHLSNTRQAGVLVPLCHVGDDTNGDANAQAHAQPSVMLTLRSQHLPQHSGEVSFPGGMHCEERDHSILDTAVREAREELGIDTSAIDIWAQMPAVPSRAGDMLITPVVAYIGHHHTDLGNLNPCDKEVAEVFTVSIRSLCERGGQSVTRVTVPPTPTGGNTSERLLPAFTGGKHRVWGLTAIILHQLLTVIATPGLYHRVIPNTT